MAVTLTTFAIEYVGDGATSAFPVPYAFIEPEHMRVSVTVGATETWLTLGSEFLTSGENEGEGVGTVTITTPPPSGAAVRIVRLVPITQLTEWRTQGPFSPVQWERALDLLTMICQQISGGAINIEDVFPGEVNGGQNIGGGVEVYAGKSGVALQFNTLISADNLVRVYAQPSLNRIAFALNATYSDVGAAPASLSATVSNHDTRINTLEGRTEAVSLRGEYKWNGSSYDLLAGAIDPAGLLPAEVFNFSSTTGRPQIIWDAGLPENYRVAVLTSVATDGLAVFPCWLVKSSSDLQLIFSSLDGEKNVHQFSLFVDFEGL